MSNKLELLSGPAIDAALEAQGATVYRYVVNNAGLYLALGLALVFYIFGGICFWQTGLSGPFSMLAFVALMFSGVGLTAVAAYWHQFATQQLVGISPGYLFVGGPKATWVIAWELLDRRAMGFETMEMTRLRGALQMHVAGQDIRLHLFNPIAYLSGIEPFTAGVLQHLQLGEDLPAGAIGDEEEE